MRRAVGADQPGPVDRETHRQVLDRDIVHHLVVGALQERRIDRAERLVALGGETRCERHRMLFGDANVERPVGIGAAEEIEPGARRHRRGDRDDFFVARGFRDQRVGEHPGIGRRVGLGLGLGAGDHVKGVHAVIFVVGRFGGRVALSLLGDHMDQHRAIGHVADIFQNRQQVVEVVAVDRPDIEKAQLLEQRAAGPEAAAVFFGQARLVVPELGQPPRELLGRRADRTVGLAGDQARQIGRHRAGRRRDRHVVVVEDDDQPRMQGAGVVHGFIGHARRHRAVADHRDDAIVAMGQIARHRGSRAPPRSRSRSGPRRTDRIRFPTVG